MDQFTATEQAYKHGREAGRAESMNWVSIKDKPFLPEPGKLYLVWGWAAYYGDLTEIRMTDYPEIVDGDHPGVGDTDGIVYWMEIKKPSDE